MLGGEEFFILDTTEESSPLEDIGDFWLFDESVVGVLRYGDAGEFLGAKVLLEERAAEFIVYRDEALRRAQVPYRPVYTLFGDVPGIAAAFCDYSG